MAGGKKDSDNIPVKDIHTINKPNTKTLIDRYVFAANFCKGKTVLDAACFPDGTKILNEHYDEINIENISMGDKVISHNGFVQTVEETMQRKYTGEIINIIGLYGHELKCTPEHPIFTVKGQNVRCKKDSSISCNTNDNMKCSKCGQDNMFMAEFIPAKEIKKNDYLAIRRLRSPGPHSDDFNINRAELLGWYLSEGSLIYSHYPHIGGICFTLHYDEDDYAKRIENLALKLGATSVTINKRKKNNKQDIRVFGKDIGTLFYSLGGKGSQTKKILLDVFGWSKEEHKSMLKSYFLGDGTHQKINESYSVKTISPHLKRQV